MAGSVDAGVRRALGRCDTRSRWVGVAALLALLTGGCSGSPDGATDPRPQAGAENPGESSSTAPEGSPTTQAPASAPSTSTPGVPPARALKAAESQPVEDPYYPQTSNPEVDILHYLLELVYEGQELSGVVTVTFRATEPTETIRLDLSNALDVRAVSLDGAKASFSHEDDGLMMATPNVTPGPTHTFVIEYAGVPEPTPAPSKRTDQVDGVGWHVDADGAVYTFQEPFGAFTWYPSNDHPSDEALYDAQITTSAPDVGVFNGTLTDEQTDAGLTTTSWHVDEPMATYLTTIAIGPYERYSGPTKSGLTITYWLMERDKRLLPEVRRQATAGFDWLVARVGPYPFSSLGFVVVGGRSAMETQTMITISRGVTQVPGANITHEIAHQWYGNSVSPTDWLGIWINEGWAMYMQLWYERETQPAPAGELSPLRRFDDIARQAAGPPGRYDRDSFAAVNVYLGPALMLDEIRKQVGDETFGQLVKAWPAEHENEHVDRAEFTRWVNDYTGQDLTALIDRWLDSPRTPRLG